MRDAKGRFASTGGGSSGRSKGGTLGARSSLKKSRSKLASKDPADKSLQGTLSRRSQKGAVTRGNKALKDAKASSRKSLNIGKPGTIAKPKGLKPGALAEKRAKKAIKNYRRVPTQTDFATLKRRWDRTRPENGGLTNNIDDRRGGMGPEFQRRLLNTMSTRKRALSVYRRQSSRPLGELSSDLVRAPFGRFSVVKNPAPAKAFPSQALGRSRKGEEAARAARKAAKSANKTRQGTLASRSSLKAKTADDLLTQATRIEIRGRRMSRAARTGARDRQIESRAVGAARAARAKAFEMQKPKPESKTAKMKRERAARVKAREQATNASRLIQAARRRKP